MFFLRCSLALKNQKTYVCRVAPRSLLCACADHGALWKNHLFQALKLSPKVSDFKPCIATLQGCHGRVSTASSETDSSVASTPKIRWDHRAKSSGKSKYVWNQLCINIYIYILYIYILKLCYMCIYREIYYIILYYVICYFILFIYILLDYIG